MSIRNAMFAAGLLLLSSTSAALGQQTADQQKCLNALNKNGAAVARTQGKENVGCLKAAGKGTLVGTAQACLTADSKGKVAKAQGKTTAAETKSCGSPPSFGYTSAAAINAGAAQAKVDLMADVYGANLDAAVISCASSKAGCGCQQKISKTVEQLAALKFSTFIKCKKAALKAGANSITALRDCVQNAGTTGSIAADTGGKIAKVVSNLSAAIAKSCDGPNVTSGAFPGSCNAATNAATLTPCLDQHVECRVCQALNDMDSLGVNCDLFDNGAADASCASGAVPTPTPTLSPTPTPTSTGVFLGALARTIGHWTYNAQNGQPGGTSLCTSIFSGHLCSLAELQTAETNGELVGAKDVNNIAIDHFWAVDALRPDIDQCITATLPLTRWAYATAHTAAKGDFVTLDNGTGDLGNLNEPAPGATPVAPVSCNAMMFSGGCCR